MNPTIDWLKSNPLYSSLAGLVVLAAVVLAIRGCGPDRLATYPVSGRVVFPDGSPVRVGTIELESIEHETSSTGTIREDGTFVLGTWSSNDGAPAGKHRVIVMQMVITDGTIKHEKDHGKPVDRKYGSFDTSRLETTIEAVEQNEIEIQVTAPPRRR